MGQRLLDAAFDGPENFESDEYADRQQDQNHHRGFFGEESEHRGGDGEIHAEEVEHLVDLRIREAEPPQSVVDVAAVAPHGILSLQRAAEEREQGIDQRDGQDHHRHQQGERDGAFAPVHHRDGRQRESQEERSGIAQEDLCRGEVHPYEAEQATRQQDSE